MATFDRNELFRLADAAIEGRLTPDDAADLERIALTNAEAMRLYVQYIHQHAALAFSAGDIAPAKLPMLRRPRRRWLAALFGIAVALLLGVGTWAMVRPSTVATLMEARACKWDGGTLPTEQGARLTLGRLRLAEGLARLHFDCGAELSLEGPADIEIMGPRRCVLRSGRLVAKVPPPASGFLVDTPTAELKDIGTEFGVHVHDGHTADLQVFNGHVDVTHHRSGQVAPVKTGAFLRASPSGLKDLDPTIEPRPAVVNVPNLPDALTISTAAGRGKDGYVTPGRYPEHHSDILLLVKNTIGKQNAYLRKAYMGFDLAPLAGRKLSDAQLTLTLSPTEMGFAAEVPDCTFSVYGLTDRVLEDWDPKVLTWGNAPANQPDGGELNPAQAWRLGSFVVPQGVQTGPYTIGGPDLATFLSQRTGAVATLIVVRDTKGSGRGDLVHGFASRRHPTLPPPTLKLTVAP